MLSCWSDVLYHRSGHVVHVICTYVTLAIIGLHDASQASIQRYVSLCICGKHEQVRSTWTPTDLLLIRNTMIKKSGECPDSSWFDCVMSFSADLPCRRPLGWWHQSHLQERLCSETLSASLLPQWSGSLPLSETGHVCSQTVAGICTVPWNH